MARSSGKEGDAGEPGGETLMMPGEYPGVGVPT